MPIALTEVISAASCFPLVFLPEGQGPVLHALLRCSASGQSAFIGNDGRWQAAWLPPRLAAWPFDIVPVGGENALGMHETSSFVIQATGGTPIFTDGGINSLSPETAIIADLLKAHADALPVTLSAATALRDLELLTRLEGDDNLLIVNVVAAARLAEDAVVALHRAGALALLHAALVSLAHLPWMAKAEKHLAAIPSVTSRHLPARKSAGAGSSFLMALAAEAVADAVPLQFPGSSNS